MIPIQYFMKTLHKISFDIPIKKGLDVGLAYFIALDKDVDFDSFVNGKTIARKFDAMSLFCEENGI